MYTDQVVRVKCTEAITPGGVVEIDSWDNTNKLFNVKKPTSNYLDFASEVLFLINSEESYSTDEITLAYYGGIMPCPVDCEDRDYNDEMHYWIYRVREGAYCITKGSHDLCRAYAPTGTLYGLNKNGEMVFKFWGGGYSTCSVKAWPYIWAANSTLYKYFPKKTGFLQVRGSAVNLHSSGSFSIFQIYSPSDNGAFGRISPLAYGEQKASTSLSTTAKHMEVDSSGNPIVADGDYVKKYNSSGVLQWSYDTGTNVAKIFIDSGDNIYAAGSIGTDEDSNSGNLRKLNSSGVLQWTEDVTDSIGSNLALRAVCVDSSGNIYVGSIGNDDSEALVIKLNSSKVRQWEYAVSSSGDSSIIADIDVDSSGSVYVASERGTDEDSAIGTLRKINSSGTKQWTYDSGFWGSNPDYYQYYRHGKAVAVDKDDSDNVYFADQNLIKFNSSGTKQWTFYVGESDTNYPVRHLSDVSVKKGLIFVCHNDSYAYTP